MKLGIFDQHILQDIEQMYKEMSLTELLAEMNALCKIMDETNDQYSSRRGKIQDMLNDEIKRRLR